MNFDAKKAREQALGAYNHRLSIIRAMEHFEKSVAPAINQDYWNIIYDPASSRVYLLWKDDNNAPSTEEVRLVHSIARRFAGQKGAPASAYEFGAGYNISREFTTPEGLNVVVMTVRPKGCEVRLDEVKTYECKRFSVHGLCFGGQDD